MVEQESRRRAVRGTTRMRQVVIRMGGARSIESMEADWPEPAKGEALVRTLCVGIDGTDEEILAGQHGEAPEGRTFLVAGHEALGEVLEAPEGGALSPGDRVVPLVRHGCESCPMCRRGASDMCPTEDYREHGIKQLDGFMRDAWTDPVHKLVKVPIGLADEAVLAEPLSIVIKAYESARHIQQRVPGFDDDGGFKGRRALLAGTGSLGSLAAFLLRQEGMHVWAMDRSPSDSAAAKLLSGLGVTHFNSEETDVRDCASDVGGFDLIIEATGAPRVVFETVRTLDANGVMCMLGVPGTQDAIPVEADDVMRGMVTRNQVLFGSVNSNRHHFEEALDRLTSFKDRWEHLLGRFVTHTYGADEVEQAFAQEGKDVIKKIIDWRRGAA